MRRRRKFRFIRNEPNLMNNIIYPIELWIQILTPFKLQGGLLVRLETKKNHITVFKSALRTEMISLLLHAISCHVNIFLQNAKNLIAVSKDRVNCMNWRTARGVRKKNWWCLTINCFIWSHFRGIVVRGIVAQRRSNEDKFPSIY